MAASDQPLLQVSALPEPPMAYVAFYSDENIAAGRAPSPPPIIDGAYEMYGEGFNTEDQPEAIPLEEHGIKRLHPLDFSRRSELKKLNFSLVTNFLDLLDIMVKCPEEDVRQEKIDDISLIFIHIHHLINEFRPFQAREATRAMLQVQKRKRTQVTEDLESAIDDVSDSVRVLSLTPAESCDDEVCDVSPLTLPISCDDSVPCDLKGESGAPSLDSCCYVKDLAMCCWVDGVIEFELFCPLNTT